MKKTSLNAGRLQEIGASNSVECQGATSAFARMEELMPLIRERLDAGQAVRLSPMGVSMLPMLREGRDSVVLTSPPSKLRKYDLPLYLRGDGKYILHRVVGIDGDEYICSGDNQIELERGVTHRQIIAVVTEFTRGEKHHSVKGVGYWLYCRFWYYSRFPRRVWRGVRRRLGRLRRRIIKS